MEIYISGFYCGPNPASGIGVVRSLRKAYPQAKLIGVDYSDRITGIHFSELDDLWIQLPWSELNLDLYAEQIQQRLSPGKYWLSCIDVEILWASRVLKGHPQLLVPNQECLSQSQKPAIPVHRYFPVKIPPHLSTRVSDWEIHSFFRKYGWQVWLKGAFFDARRVENWPRFEFLREQLTQAYPGSELFVQAHVHGFEESIAFAAYQGELLGSVYMTKRNVTYEGKTWGGQILETPPELLRCLERTVRELNWTGGGEVEMIRDSSDQLWLLEVNPRFPAWICGATLAGQNLPALLLQRASGNLALTSPAVSHQFARIVLEIPVRPTHPLPPLVQPSAQIAQPSKASSLTPAIFASAPETYEDDPAPIEPEILEDLADLPEQISDTPQPLFLRRTLSKKFSKVASWIRSLKTSGSLPEDLEVKVAYSLKTNPDPAFVKEAKSSGFLAEVISTFEAEAALRNGFAAKDLVQNGPGKFWPNLGSVSQPGVLFCDSIQELQRIAQLIRDGVLYPQTLGARLKLPFSHSRFGIPIESFEEFQKLLQVLKEIPENILFGLHFHLASSAIGVEPWWNFVNAFLNWARVIDSSGVKRVSLLDFGGGWFPDDFENQLTRSFVQLARKSKDSLPYLKTLLLEPGKALCQPAMALLLKVIEVREVSKKMRDQTKKVKEAVLDGSIAELPLAQYYPHRILVRNHRTKKWSLLRRGEDRFLGRICMEDDILARNVRFPNEFSSEDLIAFCDVGAYERSMSYVFGRG